MSKIIENLDEEEAYLWAILSDESGLDLAEFCWHEPSDFETDTCWRARDYQWSWFRCTDPLQIDQCARSVGKSLSIKLRAFAFPFLWPGQEMVITAPELNHLEAIVELIEGKFYDTRLGREMMISKRGGVTHRPFSMKFENGARIMGRIPQKDGKGVKGCQSGDTPIVTERGIIRTDELVVGDLVLTHEGRFRPVKYIFEDVNDCYEVRGQSSFPITVSCDHRFLGMSNRGTPKTKRDFEPPMFHDVEELEEFQVYWATPTKFPSLPIPEVVFSKKHRPFQAEGKDFWWLVGRYLADGHLSTHRPDDKSGSVNWCVVPAHAHEITERLETIGLRAAVTKRDHSSADILAVHSSPWHHWLLKHFGKLADGKKLPTFVLGMPEEHRTALLQGYLSGDGHVNKTKNRIECGTASKMLAVGLQLLAQSLGYSVNCSQVTPKATHINGVKLKNPPKISYRLQLLTSGHPIREGGHLYAKIKSVTPVGKRKVYNPIIEEDHSYVSGSIVSHNIHPIWLELDEGQDFPEKGWVELIETLKRGVDGAVWRAHGVTKGVRDYFYKFTTDPNSKWRVHKFTAMHRPDWTDEERQEKIEAYGSKDNPDYRRNVLGEHGDATNPLFVLSRLMKCVDDITESPYNSEEYVYLKLSPEYIEDFGGDVVSLINMPLSHTTKYKTFWIGMDVGFTHDPSEILVFAEYNVKGEEVTAGKKMRKAVPLEGLTRLKLVTRIQMRRVGAPDQCKVMQKVIDFYKPRAFSMDATGNGLPLFQFLQEYMPEYVPYIKGYKFNGKILVDFDQRIIVDEFTGDMEKDAAIERQVLEYATDKLRELVDQERLWLPWDRELIGEFQGQTYTIERGQMDAYGRKRYSDGSFHALDAARMAALGWKQFAIEQLTATKEQESVIDVPVVF